MPEGLQFIRRNDPRMAKYERMVKAGLPQGAVESGKNVEKCEKDGLSRSVYLALVVERLPVILPDVSKEERDFLELKQKAAEFKYKTYDSSLFKMSTEFEQSQSTETEVKWLKEVLNRDSVEEYKNLEEKKSKSDDLDSSDGVSDADSADFSDDGFLDAGDTSQFNVEIDAKALDGKQDEIFIPEPRITKEESNEKSLNRKLSERLYLLLEIEGRWKFPEFPVDNLRAGVNFREIVETKMKEAGKTRNDEIFAPGNAPAGYLNVLNEKELKETFFYRAQILAPGLDYQSLMEMNNASDYKWVTADFLFTEDDEYWTLAKHFLESS
eukprot:maker-scaffold_19-augustus-gene-3.9-mRNA-1 protein AED:0.23 eAED:0.23 QI:302/0.5/1/1/0.5/1/3/28/324